MHSILKNIIGLFIIAFLAVGGYSLWQLSDTYTTSKLGSITVSAEGTATAVPDQADFNFSVVTEGGEDTEALQTENTEKMNAVISYLKETGVNEENIQTSSYNVQPRYNNPQCNEEECPEPSIIGYRVSQRVDVTLKEFDQEFAGQVLNGLVERGANQVSSFRFSIDDSYLVEMEAKAQAIQRAKEKAERLAELGGFELGELIAISDGDTNTPISSRNLSLAMTESVESDSAAPLPQLQAGSEEVTSSVSLRYAIKF